MTYKTQRGAGEEVQRLRELGALAEDQSLVPRTKEWLLHVLNYIFIYLMCVCACTYAIAYECGSENHVWRSVFSFYQVGSINELRLLGLVAGAFSRII